MTVNLAVLVSGAGTMLQNFIDQIEAGNLDAKIQVVVSSRRDVLSVERAKTAGLPCEIVQRRAFDTVEAFSEAITGVLERYLVDLILLSGFLQKYLFPPALEGKVLNVHPALLPKHGGQGMYGHHVHEAVLAAGDPESGVTLHIADYEYDHGPIILQKRVPVMADDTPETLAARVFEAEKEAYPEAVRLVASGEWQSPA